MRPFTRLYASKPRVPPRSVVQSAFTGLGELPPKRRWIPQRIAEARLILSLGSQAPPATHGLCVAASFNPFCGPLLTPMRYDLEWRGRLGRVGITPRAHSPPSPAFPVSRFLERKGSWQRSSLPCRAAERATRAASQVYALRPRTALLHTSPHPPEHE